MLRAIIWIVRPKWIHVPAFPTIRPNIPRSYLFKSILQGTLWQSHMASHIHSEIISTAVICGSHPRKGFMTFLRSKLLMLLPSPKISWLSSSNALIGGTVRYGKELRSEWYFTTNLGPARSAMFMRAGHRTVWECLWIPVFMNTYMYTYLNLCKCILYIANVYVVNVCLYIVDILYVCVYI